MTVHFSTLCLSSYCISPWHSKSQPKIWDIQLQHTSMALILIELCLELRLSDEGTYANHSRNLTYAVSPHTNALAPQIRTSRVPLCNNIQGTFLMHIYLFNFTDNWFMIERWEKMRLKRKKSASFQSPIRSFHLWSLSPDWYKQQWGQDLPRQNLQTSYKIYAIKLPLFYFWWWR